MTAPHTQCPKCHRDLYPHLARRTDEGWVHSACPRACTDCGEEIGPKATSGLCRRCYEYRRRHRPDRGRGRRTPAAESIHDPRPCTRCGISTKAKVGLCRDCRDVLGDEAERWAAA